MQASSVLLLFACCACNQIAGIHDPPSDDGVPAISGDYVLGADARTNATLDTVAIFDATISYDRSAQVASLTLQPLVSGTDEPVGSASVATLSVTPGSPTSFKSGSAQIEVTRTTDDSFSLTGSFEGVFDSEDDFCGVLTGTFVQGSAAGSLPSITFAAVKAADPTTSVDVDCSNDQYTP